MIGYMKNGRKNVIALNNIIETEEATKEGEDIIPNQGRASIEEYMILLEK